jgi:hypothetical protein
MNMSFSRSSVHGLALSVVVAASLAACGGGDEGSDANYFAVSGSKSTGSYVVCMTRGPFFDLDNAAQAAEARTIARNVQRYFGFVGGVTYNTGSQIDCAEAYPDANQTFSYDFYNTYIRR